MKKKFLLFGSISIAVVCLMFILFACGFGRNLMSVGQVEKIEMTACDQVGTATVELNPDEVRQFVISYNCSRYAGPVKVESCDRRFSACIYLRDGEQISVVDHDEGRMKITGTERECYWIDNRLLLNTVQDMVQHYGLIWSTWGC